MSKDVNYDRQYAREHVNILVMPSHNLETFGDTLFNYHLVSELPDFPGKIRIRAGRLLARKPAVLTPSLSAEIDFGELGPEAQEYIESLREFEECFRVLAYGYQFKTDNFSEQVVTDKLENVIERVKTTVLAKQDPFAAVIVGEDDPWDIAIVELWRKEVERSALRNVIELSQKGELWKK